MALINTGPDGGEKIRVFAGLSAQSPDVRKPSGFAEWGSAADR
ncbi:MAG: hypothetical protein R3C28_04175 [Pirellulaceae bacterium]